MREPRGLFGVSPELDEIIREFAFLTSYYRNLHPANAGDDSQVLDDEIAARLIGVFADTASEWYDISELERLGEIRNDGRQGYRTEGVKDSRFLESITPMRNRVMLVTRTGSSLPALQYWTDRGHEGRLLTAIQVDDTASRIRVLYGNRQYGSVPSIETHVHLAANAASIASGLHSPATVHAHSFELVSLSRHPWIAGNEKRLNAVIYTQVEGLLRNYPDLIGIVGYRVSGSAQLALDSLTPLMSHRLIIWMNHGVVMREANLSRAYTLLGYAEEAARASLFALETGGVGLPANAIGEFLTQNGLIESYEEFLHYTQRS